MADFTEDDIKDMPPEKQAIARSILEARKREAAGDFSARPGSGLKPFDPAAEQAAAEAKEPGFFDKNGTLDAFSKGLAEGGTFNFANEISGAFGAADEVVRSLGSKDTGQFPNDSFADRIRKRYSMESEAWKKESQDAQEAQPDTFLAGDLVGSFAAPVPGAGAAASLGSKAAVKAVSKLPKALGNAMKYGAMAGEGAAAGALAGAGAGEGLQGSIETGFYGMGLGGVGAPLLSAGASKGWDGAKKLIGKAGNFLQSEAEREVLRAGMAKAALLRLPREERQRIARDMLNLRTPDGKYAIRSFDSADNMIDRLEPLLASLGVDGEKLLQMGDDAIARELGLPNGELETVRQLRGLFRDADNLRLGRAKSAYEETAHAAYAGEKQRLNNWNEQTKRGKDAEVSTYSAMDRSVREKDAFEQDAYEKSLKALHQKPESKKLQLASPGVESTENRLRRLKIGRKSLMQKLRNTMKGTWAEVDAAAAGKEVAEGVAAKADDAAGKIEAAAAKAEGEAKPLSKKEQQKQQVAREAEEDLGDEAAEFADEAEDVVEETATKRSRSVRAPFEGEQAQGIVAMLKDVPKEERAAAIRVLANRFIKQNDPLVRDIPFKSGRIADYDSKIRDQIELSGGDAADATRDFVASKRIWGDHSGKDYTTRALEEQGIQPMVRRSEVKAGLEGKPPMPKGEPGDETVGFSMAQLEEFPTFESGTPRLRAAGMEPPRTPVPEQPVYDKYQDRYPNVQGPEVRTPNQPLPIATEANLLTPKQIEAQSKAFGERSVPNVQVEPDANLLDGIGLDIKPMLSGLRGRLQHMTRAPNLNLQKGGQVDALLSKWDDIAEQGVTLRELRELKTMADKDLGPLAKTDIDQEVVLAVRGAIDDFVEAELAKATSPTVLSKYGNNKRNYGTIAEYLKGLDNRSAGDAGNSRFSLTDQIHGGTMAEAGLVGLTVGMPAKDLLEDGKPGALTALAAAPAVMLTNRAARQRLATGLARGYDAAGRRLETASARMTPELKSKISRFVNDGGRFKVFGKEFNAERAPFGFGLTNLHLQNEGEQDAAERRIENEQNERQQALTRTDKVRELVYLNASNPASPLGPLQKSLMDAIVRDAKAGNDDNKELKAAIFLNKGKLPSDQELDKMLEAFK